MYTEELIVSGDKMFSSYTWDGIWSEVALNTEKNQRKKERIVHICTDGVI